MRESLCDLFLVSVLCVNTDRLYYCTAQGGQRAATQTFNAYLACYAPQYSWECGVKPVSEEGVIERIDAHNAKKRGCRDPLWWNS